MSLKSTHPLYDVFAPDWLQQRDLYAGERIVKGKGVVYLPPTQSMILDGMRTPNDVGWKVYESYKSRAVFPEYVQEGCAVLLGMMHYKDAIIELPAQMEPLRTRATLTGETLLDLMRRMNCEQLLAGRVGLLADLPSSPVATPATVGAGDTKAPLLPYVETYVPEAILNWDESREAQGFRSLNLVVLDESDRQRQPDFTWKEVQRVRVLQLGQVGPNEAEGTAVYSFGVFDDTGGDFDYNPAMMKVPTYLGKSLTEIPFVFTNTRDLLCEPDVAPLVALGRLVLAIYRGEADYRQALFMQGQDTLVITGGVRNPDGAAGTGNDAIRTGAGSRIDVDMGGDAKYIGVSSDGLQELRSSVENDRKRAEHLAGKLAQPKFESESGDALSIRLSAQTANLTQVAKTGARGLENILKIIAKWIGADPEQVKITPNLEFGEPDLDAASLVDLMEARAKGAPISKKSIHELLVQKRFTTMRFEEEVAMSDKEREEETAAEVDKDKQLQANKPKPKAPGAK